MVTEKPNIIQFLNELPRSDKFKFEAELAGNDIRILTETIRDQLSLNEFFKQNDFQHCIIPDREIPHKVVIHRLPKTLNIDSIR